MVMNRLKGKMVEMGVSAEELAEKSGISYVGLLRRLKGIVDMSLDEARAISVVMSISKEDIPYYFFNF